MRSQDGTVPGEIVKAIHDDSDDNVEHDEAAEKDEGDKVGVRYGRSTPLVGIDHFPRRLVVAVGSGVARPTRNAGHHDVWPGFTGGTSEEHEEGAEDGLEVVVALDRSVRIDGNVAKHLHAHDGVDEEQHAHQQAHVGESLQV